MELSDTILVYVTHQFCRGCSAEDTNQAAFKLDFILIGGGNIIFIGLSSEVSLIAKDGVGQNIPFLRLCSF